MKDFFYFKIRDGKERKQWKGGQDESDFWVFIYWRINVINISDLFFFLMEVNDFKLYAGGPKNRGERRIYWTE